MINERLIKAFGDSQGTSSAIKKHKYSKLDIQADEERGAELPELILERRIASKIEIWTLTVPFKKIQRIIDNRMIL